MGINAELDERWMGYALALSHRALLQQEVPVGAIVVYQNQIIGEGWNQPIGLCDPTAHAEIQALRQAAKNLNNYRLLDTTLYVTLEPCPMCLGAMAQARIDRLVFAASVTKESKQANHQFEWTGGILAEQGGSILKDFFHNKRLQSRASNQVSPSRDLIAGTSK